MTQYQQNDPRRRVVDTSHLAPQAAKPRARRPDETFAEAPAAVAQPSAQAEPPAPSRNPVPLPSEDDEADENTVVLSKAYRNNFDPEGDGLRRMTFREPTARDVRTFGYPKRLLYSESNGTDAFEVKVLPDVVVKYIVLLSTTKISPGTVDQFSVVDLDACSRVINRFFPF